MFARSLPRIASRAAPRAIRCEANPQVHVFSKLPARAWQPVQRPCRRQGKMTFVKAVRQEFKRSPFMVGLALAGIAFGLGNMIFFLPWYYKNHIVKPYIKFPEPVAKKLRKAVFYSGKSFRDVREANKWFRLALQEAHELGMDPFSEEILGVKIRVSQLFEEVGQFSVAAEVLEILREDCLRWLEEQGQKHWNDGNRTRILEQVVRYNVKLGELYSSKYVNEPENAEKRLTEAVETILKEKMRREKDGVKEGEGAWMSDEEIGGALEELGTHYEENNAFYLATPLYLQALMLCPPKSCHGVVLMNNISTCLAQQTAPPPPLPNAKSAPPPERPLSRSQIIDQARQWAEKAIAKADSIQPPDRSEECDVGCATATHNLGEFFEMEGKVKEARQKYIEAESLAKAIDFREGQVNSRAGLKRLESLESGQ